MSKMENQMLYLKLFAGDMEVAEGCLFLLHLYAENGQFCEGLDNLAIRHSCTLNLAFATVVHLGPAPEDDPGEQALREGRDPRPLLVEFMKSISPSLLEVSGLPEFGDDLVAFRHRWGLIGRDIEWETRWQVLVLSTLSRLQGVPLWKAADERQAAIVLGVVPEITVSVSPFDIARQGASGLAKNLSAGLGQGFSRPRPHRERSLIWLYERLAFGAPTTGNRRNLQRVHKAKRHRRRTGGRGSGEKSDPQRCRPPGAAPASRVAERQEKRPCNRENDNAVGKLSLSQLSWGWGIYRMICPVSWWHGVHQLFRSGRAPSSKPPGPSDANQARDTTGRSSRHRWSYAGRRIRTGVRPRTSIKRSESHPLEPGAPRRAPTVTPSEASLRGRIGAYCLHATHDPRKTTAAGRAAFLARFEREVDPEGLLTVEERIRRAEAARKAYFARLALKSAQAGRRSSRSTTHRSGR